MYISAVNLMHNVVNVHETSMPQCSISASMRYRSGPEKANLKSNTRKRKIQKRKNDLYGGHYILTCVFFACNDQLFVHSAVDIVWSVHFIKVHLSFSEALASRHCLSVIVVTSHVIVTIGE